MKTNKLVCIFVFLLVLALSACERVGSGGSKQIIGQTNSRSSGKLLMKATIYIKYGVTSSPGTDVSVYDDSDPTDADGKFNFKELRKGDYFLYAVSSENGKLVSGGVHIILNDTKLMENVIITLKQNL